MRAGARPHPGQRSGRNLDCWSRSRFAGSRSPARACATPPRLRFTRTAANHPPSRARVGYRTSAGGEPDRRRADAALVDEPGTGDEGARRARWASGWSTQGASTRRGGWHSPAFTPGLRRALEKLSVAATQVPTCTQGAIHAYEIPLNSEILSLRETPLRVGVRRSSTGVHTPHGRSLSARAAAPPRVRSRACRR